MPRKQPQPDSDTVPPVDVQAVMAGLDDRERVFVEGKLRGLSNTAAGVAAGYNVSKVSVTELAARPHIAAAYDRAKQLSLEQALVTRDKVIQMLVDAYRSASTAGEMVMAARELAKLLGYYEAQKISVTHNHSGTVKVEDLKTLTVEQLERIARDGTVLEGEFTEVREKAGLLTHGQTETED